MLPVADVNNAAASTEGFWLKEMGRLASFGSGQERVSRSTCDAQMFCRHGQSMREMHAKLPRRTTDRSRSICLFVMASNLACLVDLSST